MGRTKCRTVVVPLKCPSANMTIREILRPLRSFFAYANREAAVTFVSESIIDPVGSSVRFEKDREQDGRIENTFGFRSHFISAWNVASVVFISNMSTMSAEPCTSMSHFSTFPFLGAKHISGRSYCILSWLEKRIDPVESKKTLLDSWQSHMKASCAFLSAQLLPFNHVHWQSQINHFPLHWPWVAVCRSWYVYVYVYKYS